MNWKTEEILKLIKGAVVCSIKGERKVFSSGQEALDQVKGKYEVLVISAEGDAVLVVMEEDKTVPNDLNADWVKNHVAKYGKEPNPFDGV